VANPLRAAQISLYLLPLPGTSPLPEFAGDEGGGTDLSARFRCGLRAIEGWSLVRVQLDLSAEKAAALAVSFAALPTLLGEMRAAACAVGGFSADQIAYTLLHVAELREAQQPATRAWYRRAPPPREDHAVAEAAGSATRNLLDTFDPLRPGEPRGYYYHYDHALGRKGFLAVGPRASVALGLSDASLVILALLLQSGALSPAGGLTPTGVQEVINRVSLWSTSQDVRESTDFVAGLKRSGDISTYGQIRISYALAIIGIVLAFLPLVAHPLVLAPGLILQGISGLLYANYAQYGRRLASRVGFVAFWYGVALLFAGFALNISTHLLPFSLP
jgi:hypothetical protein